MTKTYLAPNVVSVGMADVITRGLIGDQIKEIPVGNLVSTTHHMLDL
jgi:hypothetical protein